MPEINDKRYTEFTNCKSDKEYFEWMEANPNGFIINGELNRKSQEYIIHKPGCGHIAYNKDQRWEFTTGRKLKVCANDINVLITWLKDKRPYTGNHSPCTSCKPKY